MSKYGSTLHKIWENADVKALGIAIDKELKFNRQAFKIYSKTSTKLPVTCWSVKICGLQKKKECF